MRLLLWLLLSVACLAQNLKDLEGNAVSLAELRRGGRPLVLMTWCSHCACCRSGEQSLLQLQQRYLGMRMRALDAQWGDGPAQVKSYLSKRKLKLRVLFDPQAGLCRLLGIHTSTTALVWDSRGEMRYFGNLAGLSKALQQLSRGQPVAPSSTPQQGCPILFIDHLDKLDHP